MSARPGRFLDLVTTGWPKERDSTIVADPEFGEVMARLWSLIGFATCASWILLAVDNRLHLGEHETPKRRPSPVACGAVMRMVC